MPTNDMKPTTPRNMVERLTMRYQPLRIFKRAWDLQDVQILTCAPNNYLTHNL